MKSLILMIALCFFSCTIFRSVPLNKIEIETTETTPFEKLKIEFAYDIEELRIDLIRQTYEEEVDSCTTETLDVAYHPMGFDLGNGLFYDLNNNLSLRVLQSFSIEKNENYEIQKTYEYNEKYFISYSKEDHQLCENYPKRKRRAIYCHRSLEFENGKAALFYKNKP